jgi:hypothetical protein
MRLHCQARPTYYGSVDFFLQRSKRRRIFPQKACGKHESNPNVRALRPRCFGSCESIRLGKKALVPFEQCGQETSSGSRDSWVFFKHEQTHKHGTLSEKVAECSTQRPGLFHFCLYSFRERQIVKARLENELPAAAGNFSRLFLERRQGSKLTFTAHVHAKVLLGRLNGAKQKKDSLGEGNRRKRFGSFYRFAHSSQE